MIILDAQTEEIKTLVSSMGWGYNLMSVAGKEAYNRLCVALKMEPMEEPKG